MSVKVRRIKVLIVEDQPIAAMVTHAMLLELGHHADVAVDGKDALEKYPNSYDLIFMDIGLPDMTGIEVTAEIRRLENSQKHTPIVALTAYTDQELKLACRAVGIEEIIHKPANRETLKEVIVKYCNDKSILTFEK